MLVKDSNGHHTWLAVSVLWPYSYGSRFISSARRKFSKESLYTKIVDGWYIGGWPSGDERLPEPDCAVLDCIQELPKRVTSKHYLTTPVWDTFVQQSKEGRSVYVHCAYGHGRSCTMLSACLVEAGLFPNFVAAFRHISSLRPRTYINDRQKEPLLEWSRARGDTLPADINTMPKEHPPELSTSSQEGYRLSKQ